MGRGRPAKSTVAAGAGASAAGSLPKGYEPPEPDGMAPKAQAKWRAVVPMIARAVALTDLDGALLRAYCESAVLRDMAWAELERGELLAVGPNGTPFINPLIKIIAAQDAFMARTGERFGLDPASRGRLGLGGGASVDNEFTEFLRRGKRRATPEIDGGDGIGDGTAEVETGE